MAARPSKIAIVVTISKKMIDRRPSRPTCFRFECPAMPTTSVANSSGAMMVLIRRRKDQRQHAQMRGHGWKVVPDLRPEKHGDEDPG